MRCGFGIGLGLAMAVAAGACGRQAPEPRQYEVRGQIVGVDPARLEVIVDHEDIAGFMPAMVMPYKVQDASILEGKKPGDLVTATLVVEEVNAYLTTLTTTGSAPLKANVDAPRVTDADLVRDGEPVPDHALVDEAGAPFTLASLRGHRVALTFIYSRCPLPDFCPLMDRHFAEVQRTIRATPALADVRLVSVTIDPAFDRPPVLAAHAKALGADPGIWRFATGDPDTVFAFAKRFGVIAEVGETPAALVHNLRTAVIGADGRLVKTYSGNMWLPAELIADLTAAPAPQS
jgi:protein SCO1/2